MKRHFLATLALVLPCAALADTTVQMHAVDEHGVGRSIGTVALEQAPGGGVTLTPHLHGLPAGTHGFHVHETGDCGAKEKDGKMEPGTAAGGHLDLKKTGRHEGPEGQGHEGDLPPLVVGADGKAGSAVTMKRLSLDELQGKALMIHEGGDNFSDQPKPLGGGGKRIACGVVGAGKGA